ncbi:MAG: cysteine-rich CWC family protein [Polaromonas sp.]|nr:cysteine-rich CWC family protein [Polaromonas sp.]
MNKTDASTCPQCGAGLRCGVVSGDATCWCFDMPRVIAVPTLDATQKASCLCRDCLAQLIDEQANSDDPKNLSTTRD